MSGSNLFTGTLELLILRTGEAAPLHGYAIGTALRAVSDGVLAVAEGAQHTALPRAAGDWEAVRESLADATGRRAKFYRVTPAGAEHLAAEAARWARYSGAVAAILGGGSR